MRWRASSTVVLEVGAVGEQVVELEAREVPALPGLELDLDGLADPGDRRFRAVAELPVRGEQLVYLGADALGG